MCNSVGQTARLFLVDDSPLGFIEAEIMNWTLLVWSFPKAIISKALEKRDFVKPGVYLLTGTDENGLPKVYVGESDNLYDRLRHHAMDEDKRFFDQITVISNKDNNLTKSHIRFLESRLIDLIKENGQKVENANGGYKNPSISESEKADMMGLLCQLIILLPLVGLDFIRKPLAIAEEADGESGQTSPDPTFEILAKGLDLQATAFETEDGQFVVTQGSKARNPASSAEGKMKDLNHQEKIKQLIALGDLGPMPNTVDDGVTPWVFLKNTAFRSPSAAACIVFGNQSNGHIAWKLKGTEQTYGEWFKARLNQDAPALAAV